MRSNQKGFSNTLILGIIAAVVLIGAGISGYFVFVKKSGQTPVEPTAPTPTQTTSTIDTSTSSTALTAGWKTYRNEKYGFEVKYPSGWVIDEWSRAGELAGFEFHQKGVDYPKFEIDLFRALGPRTPPTYTNRETIFGKEVGINEYECLGNGWCKDVELIIEPVSLPGGNDVFGWYLRTSDLSKKDLLNQILSTFKFVEPVEK